MDKECKYCGKAFESRIKDKVYCSKTCKWSQKRYKKTGVKKDPVKGFCVVCGDHFERLGRNGNPKTCGSKDCIEKHKKQCRVSRNRIYREEGRYKHKQKQYWETYRDKVNNSPDRIKERKNKARLRELKKDLSCLKYVIEKEKKKAMEREGVFKCSKCAKTKKEKERSRVGSQVCKQCLNKYKKDYIKRNPDKQKAAQKRRYKKMMSEPHSRMLLRYRGMTSKHAKRAGFGGATKGKKIEYLGCSAVELAAYLQQQFVEGMNWDNYGSCEDGECWHIDHIKPATAFDFSIESELKECFHYTNLQPLWAADNIRKSNKEWDAQRQPEFILA